MKPQQALGKGVYNSDALLIHASKPPDDKYIYDTTVSQCIKLPEQGDKYGISASFKYLTPPLSSHANRIRIYWFSSLDCSTGGQMGTFLEPEVKIGHWQTIKKDRLTPMLGAKTAKIEIVQTGRHSNDGDANWDNVHFYVTKLIEKHHSQENDPRPRLSPGKNYLRNGSFDNSLDDWRGKWKSEWTSLEGDSALGAAKVTFNSDSSSMGAMAFNQCVDFGGNTVFNLGASFKKDETSTQSGGGRLRVTWYENEMCRGRAKTDLKWADPDKNKSGWQKLRATRLVAPLNASSASVTIIQSISGPGEFSAYWDDVYFEVVE